MNAKILDGKKIASDMAEELKKEIEDLKIKEITPGLAVVVVGSDPASQIYVRNKKKTAEKLGMHSVVHEMEEDISQDKLVRLIGELNSDGKVHGILVQLPLPKHLNEKEIILAIDPKKDVDCFHPENLGKFFAEGAEIFPCTPSGIIELLKRNEIKIFGKECVVVGRSNIVGKPTAIMLLENNATVTICHSKTKDLKKHCRKADIIVAAVGKPKFITADMVKDGAVVIDVGINQMDDGTLKGDVDFEEVKKIAAVITPVPGGVGPMTIACLMKNAVMLAKKYSK